MVKEYGVDAIVRAISSALVTKEPLSPVKFNCATAPNCDKESGL